MSRSIDELFEIAEQYGNVSVHGSSHSKSTYWATIEFQTIPGVDLQAKSNHGLPIRVALEQAISSAEKIVSEFQKEEYTKGNLRRLVG